jgi:hypothetical protein
MMIFFSEILQHNDMYLRFEKEDVVKGESERNKGRVFTALRHVLWSEVDVQGVSVYPWWALHAGWTNVTTALSVYT